LSYQTQKFLNSNTSC